MARSRKQINQINVVPYIDVMLVLLIIFMVTAPLINPGEIELPSVGQELAAPTTPIEVTVKTDRTLLYLDRETGTQPILVSRDDLIARIRKKQAAKPDQPVVIAADKATRYEDVIAVLDVLQRNGVRKVGLLARTQTN